MLGPLLGAAIAEDWPGFPQALPRVRDACAARPGGDPWGTYLFLLEEPRTLIGMGGFKAAPSADGRVEIGYAIAPAFRGRGLATKAAQELVALGFADPRVLAVEAQPLGQGNASNRVLEKIGMVGAGSSPIRIMERRGAGSSRAAADAPTLALNS